MWTTLGGFVCGALAGAAAAYGRLCTMTAVENAVIARDVRPLKAWGAALAVAIVLTTAITAALGANLATSVYLTNRLDIGASLVGGVLFGLGMALVGTCSFGVLVRTGSGDLRAAMTALLIGIAAFAVTAGPLANIRQMLSGLVVFDTQAMGGPTLAKVAEQAFGPVMVVAAPLIVAFILILPAIFDRPLRSRPRMLAAAAGLGIAVAAGWYVTMTGIERLDTLRLESLSFVAPAGRGLLLFMGGAVADAGFGVAAAGGVIVGAAVVGALKDELRWEAFDDAREMRRHIVGASLMGLGGVLARGCTIGQGMSAASALALSAPLVIAGVLIGARLGLWFLIDGRGWWRRAVQR